jgi:hypothetical protein
MTWAIAWTLKASNQSKLGDNSRVTFRVIDGSTMERVADQGNYVHRLTVRVNGKNCMAEVNRELKPGQKFFRGLQNDYKAMGRLSNGRSTLGNMRY